MWVNRTLKSIPNSKLSVNQLEKLEAEKATWLVLALLGLTRPYRTLLSLTWPYLALLGLTGPFTRLFFAFDDGWTTLWLIGLLSQPKKTKAGCVIIAICCESCFAVPDFWWIVVTPLIKFPFWGSESFDREKPKYFIISFYFWQTLVPGCSYSYRQKM